MFPERRLRRHDHRLLRGQPQLLAREDLHQSLRGGAEHALRLRADDRRQRRRRSVATGGRRRSGPSGRSLIAWVVIVTANHYWVDGVLGWIVAARRRSRSPPRALAAPDPRPGPGDAAARRERPRPELAGRREDHLASADGIFGAPKGPWWSPQRPSPRPATARSCAPTPATA